MIGVRDKVTKKWLFFYTKPAKSASSCIQKSLPSSLEAVIPYGFSAQNEIHDHFTLEQINKAFPKLIGYIKEEKIPYISLCRNPYERYCSIKNYHNVLYKDCGSREEFLNSLRYLYTEQWKYFVFDDETIVTPYKVEETKSLFGFDLVKANANCCKPSFLTPADKEFVREFYKNDFELFGYSY